MEEKKSSGSDRLAEIIEENQKRRDQRKFLEELGRRITIAREGRVAYEKGDLSVALNNYRRFLTITAKAHGLEVESLIPSVFPEKDRYKSNHIISINSQRIVANDLTNLSETNQALKYLS